MKPRDKRPKVTKLINNVNCFTLIESFLCGKDYPTEP